MSQLTNAQARSYIANSLDIDVSAGDGPTNVLNAMNLAGLRVWEARPWFGREVEADLTTVAPYTTGTVAFVQGSASITGTGTTWTAAMTGRKISTGTGQPWYRFTYISGTTGTINDAYAEASNATAKYTIFQDELDLASTAETIKGVWLYSAYFGSEMQRMTFDQMRSRFVNFYASTPCAWAPTMSQTAGIRRIAIAPIPDAVYRLNAVYEAAFTEVTIGGALCVLGLNRQRAWLLASMYEAQRLGDAKQVVSDAEVEAAIEQAWNKEQAQSPVTIRRTPVGRRSSRFGNLMRDPPVVL